MSGTGWGGRRAQGIRALLARTLPAPCSVCGEDVHPHDPRGWDVDHLTPTSLGGDPWDVRNCMPSHASCNRSRGNGTRRRRPDTPEPHPFMV